MLDWHLPPLLCCCICEGEITNTLIILIGILRLVTSGDSQYCSTWAKVKSVGLIKNTLVGPYLLHNFEIMEMKTDKNHDDKTTAFAVKMLVIITQRKTCIHLQCYCWFIKILLDIKWLLQTCPITYACSPWGYPMHAGHVCWFTGGTATSDFPLIKKQPYHIWPF